MELMYKEISNKTRVKLIKQVVVEQRCKSIILECKRVGKGNKYKTVFDCNIYYVDRNNRQYAQSILGVRTKGCVDELYNMLTKALEGTCLVQCKMK